MWRETKWCGRVMGVGAGEPFERWFRNQNDLGNKSGRHFEEGEKERSFASSVGSPFLATRYGAKKFLFPFSFLFINRKMTKITD